MRRTHTKQWEVIPYCFGCGSIFLMYRSLAQQALLSYSHMIWNSIWVEALVWRHYILFAERTVSLQKWHFSTHKSGWCVCVFFLRSLSRSYTIWHFHHVRVAISIVFHFIHTGFFSVKLLLGKFLFLLWLRLLLLLLFFLFIILLD